VKTVVWGLAGVLLAICVVVLWQLGRSAADDQAAQWAWEDLASLSVALPDRYQPAMVSALPEPARRFFNFAIEPGTRLSTVVQLTMVGDLSLGSKEATRSGRWMSQMGRHEPVASFVVHADTCLSNRVASNRSITGASGRPKAAVHQRQLRSTTSSRISTARHRRRWRSQLRASRHCQTLPRGRTRHPSTLLLCIAGAVHGSPISRSCSPASASTTRRRRPTSSSASAQGRPTRCSAR
jgi:hypothetical protein